MQNPESVEAKLAHRQLSVKDQNSNSWFIYVQEILDKYGLPTTHEILAAPPNLKQWKKTVRKSVELFWEIKLKEEAVNKSSLAFLNIEDWKPGKPHPVWDSVGSDVKGVNRAMVKAKLLVGVYKLQADVSKFSNGTISAKCILCKESDEDIEHFIALCKKLEQCRKHYKAAYKNILKSAGIMDNVIASLLISPSNFTKLVLDCTNFHVFRSRHIYWKLETVSRGLCYALHSERSRTLHSFSE